METGCQNFQKLSIENLDDDGDDDNERRCTPALLAHILKSNVKTYYITIWMIEKQLIHINAELQMNVIKIFIQNERMNEKK